MDTNTKTSKIRIQLSILEYFMETCVHGISKFHRTVKVLLDSLKVRGETKIEILTNL